MLWFLDGSMDQWDQCEACQLHPKRDEESEAGWIIQVGRTATSSNKLKVTSSVWSWIFEPLKDKQTYQTFCCCILLISSRAPTDDCFLSTPPQLYLDHFKAHIKLIYRVLWLQIWHQKLFITWVFSAADRKSKWKKRKCRKESVTELQQFRDIKFWKQPAVKTSEGNPPN